jgi:class 3 adenylate cyclase
VHNGRVVKRTGDGSPIEFRSVVDAARCAIEVQNAMVERNAGLPEATAGTPALSREASRGRSSRLERRANLLESQVVASVGG